MTKQEFAVERRIELLETIREENPELELYITSILNEMENPKSDFNTGNEKFPHELDKRTGMRLCDAFEVAKEYAEKYQLDLTDLISFVSVKTVELIHDKSQNLGSKFKRYIASAIRMQYPIRNPLLARTEYQSSRSYDMYDECFEFEKNVPDEKILEDKSVLFLPTRKIELWDCFNEMPESQIESKLNRDTLERNMDRALKMLEPIEEKILRIRFGFDDDQCYTLGEIGKKYGISGERVRQIEAKAIRKCHSRKYLTLLNEFLNTETYICSTPIGRGTEVKQVKNQRKNQNSFDAYIFYQPFCICGHQMRHRETITLADRKQKVFYCKSCGRIYEIKYGKLKRIAGYCLKNSPLDEGSWPLFCWDENKDKDFENRLMRFYFRDDFKNYENEISERFENDIELRNAMMIKLKGIYGLVVERILSKEDARKCMSVLIMPDIEDI